MYIYLSQSNFIFYFIFICDYLLIFSSLFEKMFLINSYCLLFVVRSPEGSILFFASGIFNLSGLIFSNLPDNILQKYTQSFSQGVAVK